MNYSLTKRIIVPDERQIVYADQEELCLLMPPSQTTGWPRAPLKGNEDLDGPGDLADAKETLELREGFLDKVFQDDELGTEYAAANTNSSAENQVDVNELEPIPEPDRTPFSRREPVELPS
ncbi:hypothetical protein PI124_g13371 [Phytophthora idaei]|nr:hypothetical protein PI125_g19044 [Phytophthora idaei]KAG3131776.1 hypothetical protein PI126_g19920 [Phytophthora idaei]KAG3241770.1 hypothetical protein PI124_g13371 [Phytophthora idaei]